MKKRDLARYCHDLGWRDPFVVPVPEPESAEAATVVADGATLAGLADSMQGCTLCRLSEKRQTIVFGEGSPGASVMFVGEAPGADEDRSGRPFVGQAGQLLDAMLFAISLRREEVFIANVVKCRPPGNRDPESDEMDACEPFLDRQIELIRPRVIVTLGRFAARRMTGADASMGALRGRWASYRGIPLLPVFHPAYLLRNPVDKRQMWADLKTLQEKLAGE